MSDHYDVQVTREDGYWVGSVVLPWTAVGLVNYGAAVETRRLSDLEAEVRDLVAGYTDVEPSEVDLAWDYQPAIGDSAEQIRRLESLRSDLDGLRHEYEQVQRESVRSLRKQETSLRDTATLTGMSFQRVQQIETRAA